ncbi:MAG: T9SS type A sorting domain-containing protein [Calditrichaeota bacterium]|nr:T9SS type A sorting domain-containing protein [Calditrichota bacterium]
MMRLRLPPPSAPTVVTLGATNVSTSSATLNGTVNPGRLSTTVRFQYGTSTSYGSTITAAQSPVTGSVNVSVSAGLTGLSPNTLYHYRVVATNSAGTRNGADQTFKPGSDDVTGPAITNLAAASPNVGDNITVTATITDPQGLAAVDLHYARGGSASYSQVNMLSLGANTHSGTIPGSAVTATGVACFITAEDNLGNVSRSDTASIQVGFPSGTLTTSIPGGAFRDGFPKDKWRLISIPGNIADTTVNSIIRAELNSTPSDETWKIFRFTGPEPDDYVAASSFISGESYFLKQVVEEAVHFTLGAGRSVDLTGFTWTIPSHRWHFISSPYPFPVTVAADQGTFIGPYTYGEFGAEGQEGWSMAQVQTTFQPWGGYIIYNNTYQPQALEIKPPGLAKAILPKGTDKPIDGWLLHLTAEGAHYFDAGNTVGRIQGAAEGLDDHDHPEPPYLDGYVSLAMERPDWSPNAGLSRFTSDVRTLDETNGVWDLDLRTRRESGPVAITYEIQGEVPPGSQVVLLDLVRRRAYDLTAGELPEAITNYSEQLPRRLKVIAGTPDYVQATIEEALAQLPEEFALSQNYPNPFNPSTTIEYALPKPARVSLRVYNLLGREIAVLVNDWQDMGYYEIVWQGRDRAGRSVASGVYFAVLQADGHMLTRKMLLLR